LASCSTPSKRVTAVSVTLALAPPALRAVKVCTARVSLAMPAGALPISSSGRLAPSARSTLAPSAISVSPGSARPLPLLSMTRCNVLRSKSSPALLLTSSVTVSSTLPVLLSVCAKLASPAGVTKTLRSGTSVSASTAATVVVTVFESSVSRVPVRLST